MKKSNLVNLKIKQDFEGNLYVLVPELRNDDRVIYEVVYLSAIPEPESCLLEKTLFKGIILIAY